jgi:hypothetical protein
MDDQPPPDEKANQQDRAVAPQVGLTPIDTASSPANLVTGKPLTAEEQMALYEQDLKENDWGHQPC